MNQNTRSFDFSNFFRVNSEYHAILVWFEAKFDGFRFFWWCYFRNPQLERRKNHDIIFTILQTQTMKVQQHRLVHDNRWTNASHAKSQSKAFAISSWSLRKPKALAYCHSAQQVNQSQCPNAPIISMKKASFRGIHLLKWPKVSFISIRKSTWTNFWWILWNFLEIFYDFFFVFSWNTQWTSRNNRRNIENAVFDSCPGHT